MTVQLDTSLITIPVQPFVGREPDTLELMDTRDVLFIFTMSAIPNHLVQFKWIWESLGRRGPPSLRGSPFRDGRLYLRTRHLVYPIVGFRSLQGQNGIASRLPRFAPASQSVIVNTNRPIPRYDPWRPALEFDVVDGSGTVRSEWVAITRSNLPPWKTRLGIPGRIPSPPRLSP